jgi:predicted esterase YcpF (UPF0227 family)
MPLPVATRPITHLLYLHGFRSSPQSLKARLVARRVAADHPSLVWWCPQLPPSPREAVDLLMRGIAQWPHDGAMGVIGSSLGGFYAAHMAARTQCRAVLLNPAVDPARDLARYIGTQTAWHDPRENFYFAPAFVDELRALEPGAIAPPERLLAIVAKGDEVLDWRETAQRYAASRVTLLEGGDHALSDFETRHLDDVLAFLGLA